MRNMQAREELVDGQDRLEMRAPSPREIDPDAEEFVNPLVLRGYQEELVENACRGKDKDKNTIVVAPTGSGKTEVAIFIAKYHLEERQRQNKPGRVVMLVPRIPLVEQQQGRFRQYLRHRYNVKGFHGAMSMAIGERHRTFLEADIIVMTPEILWSVLPPIMSQKEFQEHVPSREEEREDLPGGHLPPGLRRDPPLYQETRLQSDNAVYARLSSSGSSSPGRPSLVCHELFFQIVGLSASPLPTNVSEENAAMKEILKLLANANCYSLSTVVNHEESFEEHFARPDEGSPSSPVLSMVSFQSSRG